MSFRELLLYTRGRSSRWWQWRYEDHKLVGPRRWWWCWQRRGTDPTKVY